tara:strand:- start:249 stop:638 length:390 start_codon:yes stop_codon:yes gene_type:complete
MNNSKIKLGSNRSFGIVFFIFFLIISLWPIKSGGNLNIWLFIISLIFLILGIMNSQLLRPLNYIWFKFGLFLGSIVSPIVMSIIFFLVVTPISILMKIFNKDILNLRTNKKNTYWIEKTDPKSKMKNQF